MHFLLILKQRGVFGSEFWECLGGILGVWKGILEGKKVVKIKKNSGKIRQIRLEPLKSS